MEIRRIANTAVLAAILCTALVATARGADNAVPEWDASAFRDESTIEIMTTEPEEESIGRNCGWS